MPEEKKIKPRRNQTPRLTFYCPEHLQKNLKLASEILGLTVSELLRVIAEDYLDNKYEESKIFPRSFPTDVNELVKSFGEKVLVYAYKDLQKIRSAIAIATMSENSQVSGWSEYTKFSGNSRWLVDNMIKDEFIEAQHEEYLERNKEIEKLEDKIRELELKKRNLLAQVNSKPTKES